MDTVMNHTECIRTEYNWVQDLADIYHDYLIKGADPEVMKWSLVSWDRLNFFIIFCYVMFVNMIGPGWMKNRKPFDLRWLMVPYNAALVMLNFYISLGFARIRFFSGYEASCQLLLNSTQKNPYALKLAEFTWLFYMSKFIELADTVFFVLRKKDRQLSRLHLVHHSSVPILVWMILRSEPGGYNTFFPLANSFVHVIMYTYYGVAAFGDETNIHLKFKKYITITQLFQFILVLSYMFSRPWYGCNISYRSFSGNVIIAGFFFLLFCNFYFHEYMLKKNYDEFRMNNENSNGVAVNGKKKAQHAD